MKVLVTGFDPFGGEATNPAYEAVKLLPDKIGDVEVIKLEIPTVFRKGAASVVATMEEQDVDVVLSIGQAGNRSCMTVEKVAINLVEARIADNEGNQPFEQPIQPDGEPAYFATVPVKAMIEKMRENGVPAHMSFTAGTYVCNEVMYQTSYAVAKKGLDVKVGFVHVPFSAGQAVNKPNGTPFMSLEMIAKGIESCIEAIATTTEDSKTIMGETH